MEAAHIIRHELCHLEMGTTTHDRAIKNILDNCSKEELLKVAMRDPVLGRLALHLLHLK